MQDLVGVVEANWLAFALVLVLAVLFAWWLAGQRKRSRRERHRAPDALDEGAAPAARNQSLIDSPSAVTAARLADTGPDIMAGMGEAIGLGATQFASHAQSPPPAEGQGDDLTRIKGLGPRLAAVLASLGVTSLAQIAAWTEEDIERIDAQLGTFKGRIRRDNWVDQAKYLAAGDVAGFESRFGKL